MGVARREGVRLKCILLFRNSIAVRLRLIGRMQNAPVNI